MTASAIKEDECLPNEQLQRRKKFSSKNDVKRTATRHGDGEP
jgi:hypothetical protein